ncbi:MAG: hypothetical protein HFI30_08880 [Lachnospiraceae bacterium]|nr:hypothetical protein [Lachnospiraceae bacterium]MCI8995784.1 hypothetical protein [Lachnospiraceae bacterium]
MEEHREEIDEKREFGTGDMPELAMRYFAVVNFVCLPYHEFQEKKVWYAYFQNIDTEGEVLYG